MTIENITIENIKGIEHRSFDLNIIPNRPSLLVAPNGFGKSSIATAFNSLLATRIGLHDDDLREQNNDHLPSLELRLKKTDNTVITVNADASSNTIYREIASFVINGQLKVKATSQNFGGRSISRGSLVINPVVLVDNIPDSVAFNYSYLAMKTLFGSNGKVLPNIQNLLSNKSFIRKVDSQYKNLSKLIQVRNKATIDRVKEDVNAQSGSGSSPTLQAWVAANKLVDLERIEPLLNVAQIIRKSESTLISRELSILAAIQLSDFYHQDKDRFKKAVKYSVYKVDKEEYDALLSSFNTTWKSIRTKKSGSKLLVEFPKAHQISNGQRDILSFIALLFKAKKKLNKQYNILIIDEVFDYLDDANLISAQYFITKFIEEMKLEGRTIYPLILTHLNPRYFKNFAFSKQKTYYLDKADEGLVGNNFRRLLMKRNEATIKQDVSKYLLHYHPDHINKRAEFRTLGLAETWGERDNFQQFITEHIQKYLSEESGFDPLAVCCAVRTEIEKNIYNQLSDATSKTEFLGGLECSKGTKNKLKFASGLGVTIPESYYLLGIIYNDGMHWKDNQDNVSPAASKLEHPIIHKLIAEIFNGLGND